MSEPSGILLYDFDLRRPGCVLLQAVVGGDRDALVLGWSSGLWLVSPTNGMKRVRGTRAEFAQLAKRDAKLHAGKSRAKLDREAARASP